jgi:hypothetical protein
MNDILNADYYVTLPAVLLTLFCLQLPVGSDA